VSESLSKMTMARSRHQQHDDEGESNNNREGASSFEQLSTQVRSNGVGYLAGVTKLHELLAPHASLVKSYRNHTSAATAANNSNINNNTNGAEAGSSDATTNNNNGQPTQQSSELASFNPNSSEIVKMATSNMYAARVEKRLAVERREILKEMIRLEEDGGGGGMEEEGDSNKRKR